MSETKPKTKIFEFMTLFTMVIGTVIGTGIYIKNNELLQQVKNPIIGIILWVVVGIVCILSVIVFMEISSSTKHFGNGTMGNWTKLFINRKTASFFSLAYIFMYMPSNYAVFTGAMITYMLQAINKPLAPSWQLTIYLLVGAFFLFGFTLLHLLKPIIGDRLQLFGTIFKFIPLIIALIAGFFMIDKTINGSSAMFNEGYAGNEWGTSNWNFPLFLRGFGSILFAFDGYVYICNAQKNAQHKDVVPKALFFGMIFVTVFYALIAVSLFLGSPDGSIVMLFQKMFAGGKLDNVGEGLKKTSIIISNILLMIVCLLNINVFTIIGAISIESDADAKLLYFGKDKTSVNRAKAAFIQTGISFVVYSIFLFIGFFTTSKDWNGIHTTLEWIQSKNLNISENEQILIFLNQPVYYLNIISSADTAFAFIMVDILIFAALANHKTKKVKVEKVRGSMTSGIISGVFMAIFSILGIVVFADPNIFVTQSSGSWNSNGGMWFTIIFLASLIFTLIMFVIQEILFKKHPFKNGFYGQLSNEQSVIISNEAKNFLEDNSVMAKENNKNKIK